MAVIDILLQWRGVLISAGCYKPIELTEESGYTYKSVEGSCPSGAPKEFGFD
jgi:hypothetical protein